MKRSQVIGLCVVAFFVGDHTAVIRGNRKFKRLIQLAEHEEEVLQMKVNALNKMLAAICGESEDLDSAIQTFNDEVKFINTIEQI